MLSFNTQPPEGGWLVHCPASVVFQAVSTLSRLKAAGIGEERRPRRRCCFNTQPPEGGWTHLALRFMRVLCFNTQPPEGGWAAIILLMCQINSFNTQPPEGGWVQDVWPARSAGSFQHSAA